MWRRISSREYESCLNLASRAWKSLVRRFRSKDLSPCGMGQRFLLYFCGWPKPEKAKRLFFPLFILIMVLMLFSSIFKVACLRNAIFFFFSLPFCWILVGNFPRIQVVQRDYLNPTLGSPTGLFLEFRSPGRWDYAICWALLCILVLWMNVASTLESLRSDYVKSWGAWLL